MGMVSVLSINVFGFTFKDVSTEHWAYKNIVYMHEKGYMTVNSLGEFLPNDRVSYFNIAELLAKATGYQDENVVKDMDETVKAQIRANYAEWAPYIEPYTQKYGVWEKTANEEIAYLLGKGVLKVEDLEKFAGVTSAGQQAKRVLTKEDLAVYLVRVLGKEQEAIANYKGTIFADEASIKEGNRPHIAYLNSIGIVNGDTQGNFGGSTGVVRSVCAKMVSDLLQYQETNLPSTGTTPVETGNAKKGTVTRITPKSATEYFILIDQNGVTSWSTIKESTRFFDEKTQPLTLADITVGSVVTAYIEQEGGAEYISKLYKANQVGDGQSQTGQDVVKDNFRAQVVRVGQNNTLTLAVDGQTKVYEVAVNVTIIKDGASVLLQNLPVGSTVMTYLEDGVIKSVTVLDVEEKEEKGEFISLVTRRETYGLTVLQNSVQREIEVAKNVEVERNGRTIAIDRLRVGDKITFVIEKDTITKIIAEGESTVVKGRISSILLGLTPQITVQIGNEKVTYVLGTDTVIYNEQTRSNMNLRDLQIGSTIEVEASSRQATYLTIEKVPSVLSYKGTVEEVQNGGAVLYVLVEYDLLTGQTMIEKQISVPVETGVLIDGRASRRSLLEEGMEVLVLFDYADTTKPTQVMVINK